MRKLPTIILYYYFHRSRTQKAQQNAHTDPNVEPRLVCECLNYYDVVYFNQMMADWPETVLWLPLL